MASTRRTTVPFHVELFRLRRDTALEAELAFDAGVTVTEYRAIEMGHLPCSRAVYDAARARFPSLRSYPRPPVDPARTVATKHVVVTREYQRLTPLMLLVSRLNVGVRNKVVIRELLTMAMNGDMTAEDRDFFFPQ